MYLVAEWLTCQTSTLEVSSSNPKAGKFLFFSLHSKKSIFSCFKKATKTIDPILKMAENKRLLQSKNKFLSLKKKWSEQGNWTPRSRSKVSYANLPTTDLQKLLVKMKNCSPAVFKLKFQTFVDYELQKKLYPGLDKTQKEIVIKFLVHYLRPRRGASRKSDWYLMTTPPYVI